MMTHSRTVGQGHQLLIYHPSDLLSVKIDQDGHEIPLLKATLLPPDYSHVSF